MYFGAFHDAMFEVAGTWLALLPPPLPLPCIIAIARACVRADIWSDDDSVQAYVHVLTMLWVCLTNDGVGVRVLSEVRPFNLVAFEKSEGEIRGPATKTMTLAPVSLYGNSNWQGGVTLPWTFFPPKLVEEGEDTPVGRVHACPACVRGCWRRC